MGEVIVLLAGVFTGIVLMCIVSVNRISAEEDAEDRHNEDAEMHETAEEYFARKYKIGSDVDGDVGAEREKERISERVQGCKEKREKDS